MGGSGETVRQGPLLVWNGQADIATAVNEAGVRKYIRRKSEYLLGKCKFDWWTQSNQNYFQGDLRFQLVKIIIEHLRDQ